MFHNNNDTKCTNDDTKSRRRIDATVAHPLYFPKINTSFVEPSLELCLDVAKNTLANHAAEQSLLSNKIKILKEKITSLQRVIEQKLPYGMRYGVEDKTREINRIRKLLEEYWPESINEDPDDVPDPVIEEAIYTKRTRELTDALAHTSVNFAEEKRMVKELDQLKKRKEKLDREVKLEEAKMPKIVSYSYYRETYCPGTKYDVFRRLRVALNGLKECEQKMKEVREPYEPRFAEHRKKLEPLEKKLRHVEQEIERLNALILELQLQKEATQPTLYNNYYKLAEKANQFAKQGEFVALEELINKEVENFMSRWSMDEVFRANYTRSIQLSLSNEGLSSDGRMQDDTLE